MKPTVENDPSPMVRINIKSFGERDSGIFPVTSVDSDVSDCIFGGMPITGGGDELVDIDVPTT